MNILQSIGSFIASAAIAVSSFFGFAAPEPEPTLSAALPAATAVFETSLAAPITSSATTLTLTANSVRGGGSVSGYTCLTIDEGSAQAETVCGTLSGTTMTGMSRGISQSTGTTTVAALQFAHRRGANVKITDFPVIQIVKAQNNGEDTFPNQLIYAAGVTPTNTSALTDKEYVDGLAFSGAGVIDATSIAKGVVELATGAEAAASTATGGSGPLVLPASIATSTYNSATAANVVPVTGGGGTIDDDFIPSTIAHSLSLSGSGSISNIASTTVYATTTTGTWTKPANLKFLIVEVVGGGGAGEGFTSNSTTAYGGGGGGGYCKKVIPAAAVGTTETVTIGAGGTGATTSGGSGGNSSFGSHCTGTGGVGASSSAGGAGSIGTGGDLNLTGQTGGAPLFAGTTPVVSVSGVGGNSLFGYGAPSVLGSANAAGTNASATQYGSGGSGATNSSGSATDQVGGNGAPGLVVITSVFY